MVTLWSSILGTGGQRLPKFQPGTMTCTFIPLAPICGPIDDARLVEEAQWHRIPYLFLELGDPAQQLPPARGQRCWKREREKKIASTAMGGS